MIQIFEANSYCANNISLLELLEPKLDIEILKALYSDITPSLTEMMGRVDIRNIYHSKFTFRKFSMSIALPLIVFLHFGQICWLS